MSLSTSALKRPMLFPDLCLASAAQHFDAHHVSHFSLLHAHTYTGLILPLTQSHRHYCDKKRSFLESGRPCSPRRRAHLLLVIFRDGFCDRAVAPDAAPPAGALSRVSTDGKMPRRLSFRHCRRFSSCAPCSWAALHLQRRSLGHRARIRSMILPYRAFHATGRRMYGQARHARREPARR